jgi:riboflavin kinase/FMN adenylyltransferase
MKIYKDIENLPAFQNAVVTVGSFDGVHLGHRRVFEYMREAAVRLDGETVVVTFDPHPQQVLHPERDFFTINTLEENAELIGAEGIDNMIVLPFTKEFSQLPFQGFLDFLIKKIGMKAIVMGEDHNFGKGRAGNKETMREICSKNSIEIIIIPELTMAENKVRSSKIRQYIENMNFTDAERLLGHPWKKNK